MCVWGGVTLWGGGVSEEEVLCYELRTRLVAVLEVRYVSDLRRGCVESSCRIYVSIRPHTSAYVSIRQHTSAYVSIRQHTSAYVSIRQHTSAYVSIRQRPAARVCRVRAGYGGGVAVKWQTKKNCHICIDYSLQFFFPSFCCTFFSVFFPKEFGTLMQASEEASYFFVFFI